MPAPFTTLFDLGLRQLPVAVDIQTLQHPVHAGFNPCLTLGDQLIPAQRAVAIGVGAGEPRLTCGLKLFQRHCAVSICIQLLKDQTRRLTTGLLCEGRGGKGRGDHQGQQTSFHHRHTNSPLFRACLIGSTGAAPGSVAKNVKKSADPRAQVAGAGLYPSSQEAHLRSMETDTADIYSPAPAERPTWPAVRNGLSHKCPKCGEGGLYEKYLTLRTECPSCGEDLSHARADDGPAYLSILLTAKVMGTLQLVVYEQWQPEPWLLALTFCIGVTVMALALLPRFKGMIVGIQWAKRMHGF